MKRVARKKRKGGGFTRVSACHLADAQSDLLLFLRNPTRFPIRDEKLVPPRLLSLPPHSTLCIAAKIEFQILSLSLSSSVPFPSSFSHNSSLYSDFRLRILEELFRIGDVTFYSVKKLKKLFPLDRFEIEGRIFLDFYIFSSLKIL